MTDTPAWLRHARSLLGTREAPGAANNPTILGWAKRLGVRILGIAYGQDSTPWCGLFVAECLRAAGVDLGKMRVGVRASAWGTWGKPIPVDMLAPGAILVFTREGGGHVGFYVGEDATAFHVLGGNQGGSWPGGSAKADAVSITRIARSRLSAARWPEGVPIVGEPVQMRTASAAALSRNEA